MGSRILTNKKISGQQASECYTVSRFCSDTVMVVVGKKTYKLPTEVILQMLNEFVFSVEEKRVHSYLINPEKI